MDKIGSIYEIILQKSDFLETRRKIMLKSLYIKEILTIILMLLSAFISYKLILKFNIDSFSYIEPFLGFICVISAFIILPCLTIICAAGTFQIFKNTVKEFSDFVKKTCMKDLTKELSLLWENKKAIEDLPLQISDIFPAYTNIEYDDTFQGTYLDTEFHAQELKLILKGSKSNTTTFRGIAICMPANKKVKAQTIITTKKDTNIRNRAMTVPIMLLLGTVFLVLGIFGLKIALSGNNTASDTKVIFNSIGSIGVGIGAFFLAVVQIKNERRLQKIKLEDLNFDKKFNVYSEDQIEARYHVTTAFMDRLQNLQTAFGTKNIKCSFFNDKVMFAISTSKDLFEIGNLFVQITDKKQIEKFYAELSSVYNMIDYFKLAEKTGL